MGAVLIPILSFFFLKDGAAIRDAIVEAAAGARRELIDDIFSDLHLLLAQYIRALVILSIATFIFYMTFLSSMRVPYPILLSGLAALLEYIPVVGPLTASAVILLVAGFAGYQHLVWILVFLVVTVFYLTANLVNRTSIITTYYFYIEHLETEIRQSGIAAVGSNGMTIGGIVPGGR